MGRTPCFDPATVKRGKWSKVEDKKLIDYITRYGCWNWRRLPKYAGLSRCGKSCRLRWLNYLSPDIKRGNFAKEEEETIVKMHESLGNRWSAIAAHLPGRTDNEIKNHWQSNLQKRLTPMTKSNSLAKHESHSLEQNKTLIVDPESPKAMEATGVFSYAAVANSNILSRHKMTHRQDVKLEVHLLKSASTSYILESSTLSSKPISITNIDALSAPAENLEDLPCNDIFAFLEAYNASVSDSSTGTIDTTGAATTENFICDDIWALLDAFEISKESFTSLQQPSTSGLSSIAAKSRDSISSANMIDSASVTAEELQCDDVFGLWDAHNYIYE